MTHVVLALDISKTATGWAVGPVDGAPISGVKKFKEANPDALNREMYLWLNDMIDVHAPSHIWIEAPIVHMGGGSSADTLGLLWGLQSAAGLASVMRLATGCQRVAVATARKSFTGKGTYPTGEAKMAIIRHAQACGWLADDCNDDARADACCVWAHGAMLLDRSVIERIRPQLTGKSRLVPLKKSLDLSVF